MELVRILGIDPSLRNTGIAIVTYNTELATSSPEAFTVSHCQTLTNPLKYTGTDAILNMMDMMSEQAKKECYQKCDQSLIESPPLMFNKSWSASTVSLISHVAGAAVAIFGIERSFLFRPNEWNKCRKKEITHKNTVDFLGNPDNWHYEKRIKSDKHMEHILDAASMALWWIKLHYVEE